MKNRTLQFVNEALEILAPVDEAREFQYQSVCEYEDYLDVVQSEYERVLMDDKRYYQEWVEKHIDLL